MKPFRFKLQALLTLRQRTEQKALEHYASALLELRTAAESLDAVHREQEDWFKQWRTNVNQARPAAELAQAQTCGRSLVERQRRAEIVVQNSQAACHETLRQMLLARRDREAV